METDFCGPALPLQFGEEVQSGIGSDPNRSDQNNPNMFSRLSKEALAQNKT